jgi:hypothetical protein
VDEAVGIADALCGFQFRMPHAHSWHFNSKCSFKNPTPIAVVSINLASVDIAVSII